MSKNPSQSINLTGKTVVLAGTFKSIKREEAKKALSERGVTVMTSITGATDLLIAGARAGSKLKRAEMAGITIVDETALAAFLSSDPSETSSQDTSSSKSSIPWGWFWSRKSAVIAVSGRFREWAQGDIEALIRARGSFKRATPTRQTHAFFSGDREGKKVDKARSLGVPIFFEDQLRDAFGPPLSNYRERLENSIRDKPSHYANEVFALGDPAPSSLLARVEERIGFELPPDARNLWSQLDGLTYVWTNHAPPIPTSTELLPWHVGCGDESTEFWARLHKAAKENPGFLMGMCCIPPVETIFFTKWDGMMFSSSGYGAKNKLKLGKRKVNAKQFFENLFLFDCFNSFYQAGLWADPETKKLWVVYGSDHGACWDMAAPLSLEVYMEALMAEDFYYRPITLTNKLSAVKSTVNLAGKPYWILDVMLRHD